MGAGGKEVTLDVFEWHLKKLLYIIDKLPKEEREKAVLILRNSANHYSNLTSGHPLPPAPCPPAIYSSLLHANQSLAEIPVSQVAKTFDLMKNVAPQQQQLPHTQQLSPPPSNNAGLVQNTDNQSKLNHTMVTNQKCPSEENLDLLEASNSSYTEVDNNSLSADTVTASNEGEVISSTKHKSQTLENKSLPGEENKGKENQQTFLSYNNSDTFQSVMDDNTETKEATYEMQQAEPSTDDQMCSSAVNDETENQAILEEIGKMSSRLAAAANNDDGDGNDEVDGPGGGDDHIDTGFVNQEVEEGEDDWDQHILDDLHQVTSQHTSMSNLLIPQLPGLMNSCDSTNIMADNSTNLDVPMSTPQGIDEELVDESKETVISNSNPHNNNNEPLSSPLEEQADSLFSIQPEFSVVQVSEIKCFLCFKTAGMFESFYPQTCRACKNQFCGNECNIHHNSECKNIAQLKPEKSESVSNDLNNSQTKRKVVKPKKKGTATLPKTESVPENTICHDCNKEFATLFTYKAHMTGHKENDCKECPTKCATRKLLVAHMRAAHNTLTAEKYYNCKFCPRKFMKTPSLWRHYSVHATGDQKVCNKCGEIVENEELFAQHMSGHASSMLTCHLCGDIFARKQQYKDHIKDHNKYPCSNCDKSFPSKKRLQIHNREEEAGKLTTPLVNINQNTQNIVLEVKKVEEPKPTKPAGGSIKKKKRFKCGFCPFQNSNYKIVLRHEKRHKKFRKFVCELCGKSFNSDHNLKEHTVYVHRDERKFKCTKCEKSFKLKNALIRHQSVHTDLRSFQCFCGKEYKRRSHLNRHFAATSHGYESSKRAIVGGPAYSGSLAPQDMQSQHADTIPADPSMAVVNDVTDDHINTYDAGLSDQSIVPSVNTNVVSNTNGLVDGGLVGDYNMHHNQHKIREKHTNVGTGLINNTSSMDFFYGTNSSTNIDLMEARMDVKEESKFSVVPLPSMMSNHHQNNSHSSSNNLHTNTLMNTKESQRSYFFKGESNYDKLKQYKIPKKYSGVQLPSVQSSLRYDPYQSNDLNHDKMNSRMSLHYGGPSTSGSGNMMQSGAYTPTQHMSSISNRNHNNQYLDPMNQQQRVYSRNSGAVNTSVSGGSINSNDYDRNNGGNNANDRLPAMLFTDDERDILRAYSSTGGDRMDYSSGAVMIPEKLSGSDYDGNKNTSLNSQFQMQKHESRGGYYDKESKGYDKMYQEKLYYQDKTYTDKDLHLDERMADYYDHRGFIDKTYADKQHLDSRDVYSDDQRNYYDKNFMPLEASMGAGSSAGGGRMTHSTGPGDNAQGNSGDTTFSADDRQLLRDSMQSLDSRFLGSPATSTSGEFLLSSLECGPADLTVTGSSKEPGNTGSNHMVSSAGSSSLHMATPRDDFLNTSSAIYSKSLTTLKPRTVPVNSSGGINHRSNTGSGFSGSGQGGIIRQASSNVQGDASRTGINDLEELENFRSQQELGYTGRQNMYYEPLDSFNMMIRNDASEDNNEKRNKFIRQDKFTRHEDFLSPPGRQDIPGSLPPLLALNPSLGQPGTEPLSPRENYMCTPANNNPDNMNSQYMSESGLDYSGVYILP